MIGELSGRGEERRRVGDTAPPPLPRDGTRPLHFPGAILLALLTALWLAVAAPALAAGVLSHRTISNVATIEWDARRRPDEPAIQPGRPQRRPEPAAAFPVGLSLRLEQRRRSRSRSARRNAATAGARAALAAAWQGRESRAGVAARRRPRSCPGEPFLFMVEDDRPQPGSRRRSRSIDVVVRARSGDSEALTVFETAADSGKLRRLPPDRPERRRRRRRLPARRRARRPAHRREPQRRSSHDRRHGHPRRARRSVRLRLRQLRRQGPQRRPGHPDRRCHRPARRGLRRRRQFRLSEQRDHRRHRHRRRRHGLQFRAGPLPLPADPARQSTGSGSSRPPATARLRSARPPTWRAFARPKGRPFTIVEASYGRPFTLSGPEPVRISIPRRRAARSAAARQAGVAGDRRARRGAPVHDRGPQCRCPAAHRHGPGHRPAAAGASAAPGEPSGRRPAGDGRDGRRRLQLHRLPALAGAPASAGGSAMPPR